MSLPKGLCNSYSHSHCELEVMHRPGKSEGSGLAASTALRLDTRPQARLIIAVVFLLPSLGVLLAFCKCLL